MDKSLFPEAVSEGNCLFADISMNNTFKVEPLFTEKLLKEEKFVQKDSDPF